MLLSSRIHPLFKITQPSQDLLFLL
uniref:Uncharacterized protein n=1 Tax=Anguilla anguilla TaxID=7936 RepID=A0A0E9WCW3_ANGAN